MGGERAVVVDLKYDEAPQETSWKLTDSAGVTLVDSDHFDEIYAGPKATHYYCFPEETCLYFLIKDSAGNGLDAAGHYEVKYGPSQSLMTVASATSSSTSAPTSSAAPPRAPSSRRWVSQLKRSH